MASSDDIQRKVIELLGHVKPAAQTPKPKRRSPAKPSISINGDGNIVGNGNVVARGDINLHPVIRPKVVVKTGDGVVDAAQKAELLRMLDAWVDARNAVRKGEFSYPASRKALNNAFGVNSYHELPAERFGEARAWIQRQIAIINNMPSAKKKVPGWRSTQIAAIKARCKNQLGDVDFYKPYIESRFGKSSLSLLTDDELQATKQYVFGK